MRVFGVEDAVGDENNGVAGFGCDIDFLVHDVGKQSQRETLGADGEGLASATKDGLDCPGVGYSEGLVVVVPEREEQRDILRLEFALLESVIEGSQHLRRLRLLSGGGAHDPTDQRGKQSSRRGFAADVAEDDGGAVGAVVDEVVKVAANGAGGKKANRHFSVGVRGRGRRQQAKLNLASHGDVALELRLLAADSLVEAGIFNGDGNLCGHRGQRAHVPIVKEPGAGVFQVEHADDAAFIKQRHDQLGAGFRVHRDVTRVFADIVDIDGAPLSNRRAHQAGGDGNAARRDVRVAEAPRVTGDEGLAFVVEQHDGEHLVVDEAAKKLADAFEQRVEIENGDKFDGDFVEDFEGLRLTGYAGVQAGILDGLSDAGGGEGEQMEVLGTEVAGLFAFDVHDADEAILCDEGHGQFGANVRVGGDVVLRCGDVVKQDGLARKGHLSGNALAERNAGALDLGSVADLEAHAKLAGVVVEEEDGEYAVMDDGADEFGGAIEKGLKIECGVEGVGNLGEISEVAGLDADVYGVKKSGRARRAIVAFEVVVRRPDWGIGRHAC